MLGVCGMSLGCEFRYYNLYLKGEAKKCSANNLWTSLVLSFHERIEIMSSMDKVIRTTGI